MNSWRHPLRSFAATAFAIAIAAAALWMLLSWRIDQLPADGPTPVWRALLFRDYWSGVAGLTLVAGAVLVPLLRRRMAALERLQRWAEGIAADDLTVPPPVISTADELGELSRRLEWAHRRIENRIAGLQRDRARGDSVLRHMAEGVIAVGRDRRIVLSNEAAHRLLEFGRGEGVGRPLVDVIRAPEIHQAVDAVLDGSGLTEIAVEAGTEPRRFLRVQVAPLPGEPAGGAVLSLYDQTAVRRLETLRREFVANVSHELKTPLAAIKGYAETLQLGALEDADQARRFVDQIASQSERLEALIVDMLQLARAQGGSQALSIARLPVEPVLRESAAAYRPVADRRRQRLRIDPLPRGCEVWADREALLTIVNNLLGNAVRYTPPEGEIGIGCERAGRFWRLTVRDTGIGIPAEDLDRVFERFYRVAKARDQQHGGTGLGLAIVKNLVRSLRGRVEVESRPGQGSRFHVFLPAGELPYPEK